MINEEQRKKIRDMFGINKYATAEQGVGKQPHLEVDSNDAMFSPERAERLGIDEKELHDYAVHAADLGDEIQEKTRELISKHLLEELALMKRKDGGEKMSKESFVKLGILFSAITYGMTYNLAALMNVAINHVHSNASGLINEPFYPIDDKIDTQDEWLVLRVQTIIEEYLQLREQTWNKSMREKIGGQKRGGFNMVAHRYIEAIKAKMPKFIRRKG